jgi:hypothetical protein
MNVSVGEVVPFTAPHATEQICGGHGVRSLSALRPTLLRRLPMRRGALFVRSATRPGERLLLPHVPEGLGQPFMAFLRFRADQVHWSKPADNFKSSNMVERGFCAACGTPLTWRRIDGPYISLTLNSLDQPERVLPEMRFSAGSAPAWCHAPRRPADARNGFDEGAGLCRVSA